MKRLITTTHNSRKKQLFFLLISSWLLACTGDKVETHEHNESYTLQGDTVTLTAHSIIKQKLLFHEVVEQAVKTELTTAGIVRAIPTAYAEIAPPFAGRVLKSYVKLGQRVEVGSPIFELSSPDYFKAQKEYFDAKQEYRLTELNLKRQQDLLKNGVGVQRELEEAETAYTIQKSALANATAALKIFNIDPEKSILGQALKVVSPIRGNVLTNKIVMGQYIKEDAEPLAVVAELSKVWIAGQVKEKDIASIHDLKEVEIQVAAYADKTIAGKIYHVNNIVNEDTRSVEVLIECLNPNQDLKPGMYVSVHFKNAPSKGVLIPSKSIFQKEDKQFVFLKLNESQYVKRQIETAGTSPKGVIVKSGLQPNDVIVAEGGSLMVKNYG